MTLTHSPSAAPSQTFVRIGQPSDGATRLVCFPYAGASRSPPTWTR
jgi:hypothetical protein